MKTALSSLLDMFTLPLEAKIPFREAEICYRAGAYRAALLFSYVGWGMTLRSRLLHAACPPGIQPGQWQTYLTALNAEDRWDAQVFDLTQMNADVFKIPVHLRQQVHYWKDRRNDCAHFKDNQIDHPHVEAFWQFLLSNLGKFVPNGGEDAMVNEIQVLFDPNLTQPNTPADAVAAKIPHSVERPALRQFFQRVVTSLTARAGNVVYRRLREIGLLFDAVIRVGHGPTVEELRLFLIANQDCLLEFIRQFPQHVTILHDDAPVVRQLWHQHLFTTPNQDLPLFAALLRNNLIPEAEKDEAFAHIIPKLDGSIPSPVDDVVLRDQGFFQVFEQRAFEAGLLNDFGWANRNDRFIAWYIDSHPISLLAARAICQEFAGGFYPFDVRATLSQLFLGNQPKRDEFAAMAQQQQLQVPASLLQP